MPEISKDDFLNWTKDLFTNVTATPRYLIIADDFIKTMRETEGDEYAYNFIISTHIMCGQETLDYIEKFKKEYELRKSKNNN